MGIDIILKMKGNLRMEWVADFENTKSWRFVIRHDETAGYYFIAYEGSRGFYDELQDTFDLAKESAFEEFGVPRNSWKKIN